MPPSPSRPRLLRNCAIWSIPRRLLGALLLVEVLAVAVVVDGVLRSPEVTQARLWTVAVLVTAGVLHTEAALGVERMRRRVDQTAHLDLSSVWTFAAALLLPGCLATAVVLLVYLHLYLRAWRRSGFPPYRVVFSTATVVLAVHAAIGVVRLGGSGDPFRSAVGLLLIVLAVAAYALVNLVLVVIAIRLIGSGTSWRDAAGHRDELLLEFATLAMGAVVAAAVAVFGPAYAFLVLPPLVVLHRTVLVRQLEEAASTDAKTGLLNAAAWRLQADLALRSARHSDGTAAVLLLDLDHFKLVNDRYGHLAGDQVLSDIGAALHAEVREHDVVGRYGGEEFVVLLAAIEGEDLRISAGAVADRIRRRIDDLRPEVPGPRGVVVLDDVTVSVGVATYPADGGDLDRLLEVADSALYAAKAAGRNLVRHRPRGIDPDDRPVRGA